MKPIWSGTVAAFFGLIKLDNLLSETDVKNHNYNYVCLFIHMTRSMWKWYVLLNISDCDIDYAELPR